MSAVAGIVLIAFALVVGFGFMQLIRASLMVSDKVFATAMCVALFLDAGMFALGIFLIVHGVP